MEKILKIPGDLLPINKKFGCGPSAISDAALAKIANSDLIGTSHRQKPVRDLVGKCQSQLMELFQAPADYQVVLGNGGATTFWAVATASLVREQALHSVFGSFGEKFYQTTAQAPFLAPSLIKRGGVAQRKYLAQLAADPARPEAQSTNAPSPDADRKGTDTLDLNQAQATAPARQNLSGSADLTASAWQNRLGASAWQNGIGTQAEELNSSDPLSELAVLDEIVPGVDAYCYPHHETSTGVIAPLKRVGFSGALNLVDATSIAGAVPVDLSQVDAYYFSLQKCFASEGGLWISFCSPQALDRAEELAQAGITASPSSSRWVPEILNLHLAAQNSAKQQTLNTPAIATLELLSQQLDWMEELGGLAALERRCRQSSQLLYQWADQHPDASAYVTYEQERSPVVVTINFQNINADKLIALLRANQILDVNPYRGIARNQIRISCFPTISPEDISRLIACMDYLIAHADLS